MLTNLEKVYIGKPKRNAPGISVVSPFPIQICNCFVTRFARRGKNKETFHSNEIFYYEMNVSRFYRDSISNPVILTWF
jgi:hypothetical protein